MKSFTLKFSQTILFFLSLLLITTTLKAQQVIDINEKKIKDTQQQEIENIEVKKMFPEADRIRLFDYNKQLLNITSNNLGDTLLLSFFNDKQYKSVIQKVAVNYMGRISITSKIAGTQFAYCFITVSNNTISISAELPANDEYFFASVKDGQAYISQVKKSLLDKNALIGTELFVNSSVNKTPKHKFGKHSKGIDDPIVIDILVVYTPAAEQWALGFGGVTDIFDVIDQALQRANLSAGNSETGITFEIAYIHKTDYVETNTVDDLYSITDPWDGIMDEVHDLRDEYYADEILFIPAVDFTGGVAWLLKDENGFDPDYYAVALSRVQQTSWTYTAIHEIGHNMGAHHHRAQKVQPGPGLFDFSSGWRGKIDVNYYCSLMTYEKGIYFDDGQDHVAIPYFSSPKIIIDGVTIGDPSYEDNALTLKRTKTAVSNYRIRPVPTLTITPLLLNFGKITIDKSASLPLYVSGTNITEDISFIKGGSDTSSFEITQSFWYPTTGGKLNVTFSPAEEKEYSATITFRCSEVEDITVELNGTGILPVNINENNFDNINIYSYLNYIFIQNEKNILIKTIEVYDMYGRLVYQKPGTNSQTIIPLQVSTGIYSVRLLSSDDKIITKQLPIVK